MGFLIVLLLILIVLLILYKAFVNNLKSSPKTQPVRSEAGSFHGSSMFQLVDGIDGWGKGILVIKAELWDDGITFYKSAIGNSEHITLRYNQITGTDIYSEEEILEKSKSVVGRAVAGSLLFGPLGAIIGGMSGTGTTSQKRTDFYYTITFTKSNNTPGMITLGTSCSGCTYSDFNKILKQFISSNGESEYL